MSIIIHYRNDKIKGMLQKSRKYSELLTAIIISARPNTWLRIWGEMIIAAALASYPKFNLTSFTLTFLVTSPLLWSGMYMLNDLLDIPLDKQHPFRKTRPITTGELSPIQAKTIIIGLTISAFVIGILINFIIPLLLLCLTLSQLAYVVKPFRFKERPFWDIIVNGLNSAIRFALGWYSQTVIHPFYIYPLLLFVAIKLILFIGHRRQNKVLEIKNNIQSTVTTLSQLSLNGVLTGLGVSVIILYLNIMIQGIFPLRSLWAIIAAIPLGIYLIYKRRNSVLAQETDLSLRNVLYVSYFLWANIVAWSIVTQ
jgi:4-hydroxybenzoate polyprenyltransferase